MNLSHLDFMLLQKSGIDLFLQYVDAVVQRTGEPYQDVVKRLQKDLNDYGLSKEAFQRQPVEGPAPEPMTMRLGDLLDRRTCRNPAYNRLNRNIVYIIRDAERVKYVGSTKWDARTRMKSHQKAHSPLGEALRKYPFVNEWSVEMIPHADYDSALSREKQLIAQLVPELCRRF